MQSLSNKFLPKMNPTSKILEKQFYFNESQVSNLTNEFETHKNTKKNGNEFFQIIKNFKINDLEYGIKMDNLKK